MNIIELKKISMDFRRVSNNMFKSKDEDNNIYLIRFKNFIEETPLIKEFIQNKTDNIDYNYKESFLIKDGGWIGINIPIDENEHIKAMYEYLIDITDKERNLAGIALHYLHSSRKINECIQGFLYKVFGPLYQLIIDYISGEIMIMEESKSSEMTINQKIENMYGTNNIAGRDVTSTNNVTLESKEDIKMLIENIISMMEQSNIDEDIIDEVHIIQEQVNNEEPKERRIQKACNSLKNFISSAPKNIANVTAIVTNLTLLIEKLSVIQNS